ncbi:hypothetical protein BJ508DRAFT_364581 [Ascobolus immersus RN42]|uniref:Uncharacterized protein n=1 Tax=Ascobolus immersus RN42 TaxID=1160509 RepID=A0A3N4HVJ7_ASCIM|nr:hypothetical protein BJ508DRAFT_364579 [Ascobolus immersus RN42]RPA77269.1 hypothetical protein BJ508DRAFT_364581 [Ascobolus immersus RN42]
MADPSTASLDWYFSYFAPPSWDFRRFLHHYTTITPKPTVSATKIWTQKLDAIRTRTPPFEASSTVAVRRAKRILRALEHSSREKDRKKEKKNSKGTSTSATSTASSALFSNITNSSISINIDSTVATPLQPQPTTEPAARDPAEGTKTTAVESTKLPPPAPSETSNGTTQPPPAYEPPTRPSTPREKTPPSSPPYRSSTVSSSPPPYTLPDLRLSDGRTLRQLVTAFTSTFPHRTPFLEHLENNIFFLPSPHFRSMLPAPSDLKLCQELLPSTLKVPAFVKYSIQAWSSYIDSPSAATMPRCPETATLEELGTWTWIQSAVTHFTCCFDTITSRGPSHGEGWADANIWAPLLDALFLRSKTLTLDRKELQANTGGGGRKSSYDGIVRSTGARRVDLGYIEVKPVREPYAKSSSTDRGKVVEGMKAALTEIRQSLPEAYPSFSSSHHEDESEALCTAGDSGAPIGKKDDPMKDIVVVGLLCNGMTLTVLRAWNVLGDFYFFREDEVDVEMAGLGRVLEVCWRVRGMLEGSLAAVGRARAGRGGDL